MPDLKPPAAAPSIPSRLTEILKDKGLAKLGDAYINLLYSYTLSSATGSPTGGRVSDQTLFNVAHSTGIRRLLPPRTHKGRVADSVESLIAYAWLKGVLSFEKMAYISVNGAKGFDKTLTIILKKILDTFEEWRYEASSKDPHRQ